MDFEGQLKEQFAEATGMKFVELVNLEVLKVVEDIEERIKLCLKSTNKDKEKGMPYGMDWKAEALGYKTSLECVQRTREKYKLSLDNQNTNNSEEYNPYGKDKESKAIWECLKRMYKEAQPSVDIEKISKSGKGKKRDWFMKYYLPQERQTQILDKVCKEMKLTGLRKRCVYNTLWMGCAPNSSKETWEKERGGCKKFIPIPKETFINKTQHIEVSDSNNKQKGESLIDRLPTITTNNPADVFVLHKEELNKRLVKTKQKRKPTKRWRI